MRKKPRLLLGAAFSAVLVVSISTPATAAEFSVSNWRPGQSLSASASASLITDFVKRVNTKWDRGANAADYEVMADQAGITIKHRNMQAGPATSAGEGPQSSNLAGSVRQTFTTKLPKPTLEEVDRAKSKAAAGIQQEPNWHPSFCAARYNVTTKIEGTDITVPVGWLDYCEQLGQRPRTGVEGERVYWAVKAWATCRSDQQTVNILTLTSCGIEKRVHNTEVKWNDWGPRSDAAVGQCRQFQYGLAIGPVTGSWSFPACDLLDIDKRENVQFGEVWRGRASGKERSMEFAISFNLPFETAWLSHSFGLDWDVCRSAPGRPCDDTQ